MRPRIYPINKCVFLTNGIQQLFRGTTLKGYIVIRASAFSCECKDRTSRAKDVKISGSNKGGMSIRMLHPHK